MLAKLRDRIPGRGMRRRNWPTLSLVATLVVITVTMGLAAGCDEITVGCADETTEIRDDSFAVSGAVRLVVKTGNGAIEVKAGSDDEVRVQAELRVPDRIDYRLTQEGDTITVEARVRDGGSWTGCIEAGITITAPATSDVDLDTSNGRIALRGIEGTGQLRTSNGAIELDNVKGDFDGRTSNGEIDIDAFEGSAVMRASNGQVRARAVKGEFDLETSNGRVSFSGELTAGGNNRLETSNGRVEVELTGTPSVSIEATTSTGDITSELPMTTTLLEEHHIIGTIGDGEASLYIRTSNGDVDIR